MAKGERFLPAWAVDSTETLSWLFCTSIYFTWYNPIGELAKMRGVDYSDVLHNHFSWIDKAIPYMPWMIIPYVAVYAMPTLFILSTIATRGLDMDVVRRFFITQIFLISVAFVCYLAVPVQTDLLYNAETGKHEYGDSLAGRLCFKFVHQGISLFVACPSMHTAHSFSIAAAFAHCRLKGTSWMKALAMITLVSTVGCKGHRAIHLPFGLLLALCGHRLVYCWLARHLTSAAPSSLSLRFYVAALAPVLFIIAGEHLHRLSGWNTDVPAMFGFESNPVHGLYGFRV